MPSCTQALVKRASMLKGCSCLKRGFVDRAIDGRTWGIEWVLQTERVILCLLFERKAWWRVISNSAMGQRADRDFKEKTEDREYRPLEQIRDNYPKFAITRADPIQHRSGILHENATDLIGEGRDFSTRRSWVSDI
jgi:hypothetical protein